MSIFVIFQIVENSHELRAICDDWEKVKSYLLCEGEVLDYHMDTYLGDRVYAVAKDEFKDGNVVWPKFPWMDVKEIFFGVRARKTSPRPGKRAYKVVLQEFWQPPKHDLNDLLDRYGSKHSR